jgi:hypothetical protein
MKIVEGFQESLLYIFRYKNWLTRIWPILLIPFIPVIGLFGFIILKGWRFEMVRSIAFERNEAPRVNIALWIKRGVILWLALAIYFLVPWAICRLFGVTGIIGIISDFHILFDQGIGAYIEDYFSDLITLITVYTIWGLIATPTFQCGMVMYVLSDDWKSLFNFYSNFVFAIRNIMLFMKFFVMWILFLLTVFVVDSILAATMVGVFFIPLVTITGFYITTAHELGELALKIRKAREPNDAVNLQTSGQATVITQ